MPIKLPRWFQSTRSDKNVVRKLCIKIFRRRLSSALSLRRHVPARLLKRYADAIRQYHLQPENKFLNGNYDQSGQTIRRHVLAIRTMHMTKAANDLERQTALGYDQSAQPAYGYCPADIAKLQAEIKRLCGVFSTHQLAQYGKVKRNWSYARPQLMTSI